ncbi:MAG: 3-oxoacyl-ACP reductase FabG, partial [Spirochaetales bacterium]|nr:3-oxoacyl-ACP reductase FabG [Spirochaetales bacterium]
MPLNDGLEARSKVAVITGAASGIGKAVALTFARSGIIPIVVDINDSAAAEVLAEIESHGLTSKYYRVDVSQVEPICRMIDSVAEEFGSVDILVNNAGTLSTSSIADLDEAEWDRTMNINTKGAVFATKQALKYMIPQKWGRIINISSIAGRMGGYSAGCAYSASKSALIGMTMNIARKVGSDNITVNAVAPGTTKTDMVKGFTKEELEGLEKTLLMGKLINPENIADTVAFLASDAAEFITGAVIDINGGM